MKKRFFAVALTLILCCSAMFMLSACGNSELKCSTGTKDNPWTFSVGASLKDAQNSGSFTLDGESVYKWKEGDEEKSESISTLTDLLASTHAAVTGSPNTRTATVGDEVRYFNLTAFGCTIKIYYTVKAKG